MLNENGVTTYLNDLNEYRGFKNSAELITQLGKGYALYHAPMDSRPYTVKIKRFVIRFDKPDLSTITFWTSATGNLTINFADHFDRFQTSEPLTK